MTSSTISSSSRTNTRFSSTTEPVASEVPQGYGYPPLSSVISSARIPNPSRPASSSETSTRSPSLGGIRASEYEARFVMPRASRTATPSDRTSSSNGSGYSHRSGRSSGSNGSFRQKFENFVRFWSGLDPYWGIHRGDSQYSVPNRVRSPPGRYARTRSSTPSIRDRSRENAQIVSQDLPYGSARRAPRQASTLPSIRIAYGDPPSSDLNPRPSRHASPRPTVWPGRESHWSSLRSQSHLEMQAPIHRHMYAPPASSGPLRSKPTTASGHLHNNSSHGSEHTRQGWSFAYVSRENTAPITICEPCFNANVARRIVIRRIGETAGRSLHSVTSRSDRRTDELAAPSVD